MEEQQSKQHREKPRLQRPGLAVLIGTLFAPFMEAAFLFGAAGTLAWPRAWLFLAVSLVGLFGQIVIVAICNPELVNHRGRWREKKDTKRWDKVFVRLYALVAFYVLPIVMGLDVGRYHWSGMGLTPAAIGTILFLLGSTILTWSMLANTHFESTVRIQHDRAHKVVTTGPYAFVRHPGYTSICLWALATPLIVGSAFGFVPAGLAVAILVLRTSLEDRTLHRELPGYPDYAARIRYRLVPGLW